MDKKNVLRKGETRGSISSQLLVVLIPMIALFIIIVAAMSLSTQGVLSLKKAPSVSETNPSVMQMISEHP